MRTLFRRKAAVALTAVAAAASLTACSGVPGFNPSAIPAPGQGGGGAGYIVHLDFPSVLNLPDRARVVVNGVDSGRLQKVSLQGGIAVLDVKINDGVQLPAATTATLQQDTILGDVYVALTAPTTGYNDLLHDGSTVPLSQTKAPTQIEDLLRDLSNFLGSGSLIQVQDTFKQVNDNLPADPKKLQALVKTISQTTVDLGQQSDNVSQVITSMSNIVNQVKSVNDSNGLISSLLAPGGDQWLKNVLDPTAGYLAVVGRLSDALAPLTFSIPLLDTTSAVLLKVVKPLMFPGWPNMNGRPANLANLQDLLENKVLPWLENGPKINVQNVGTNGQVPNEAAAQQVVKTLRTFGAVP
ncbi:MlaD family protein [Tsukamurella soli]|uniref:MlaD family protein n=1 Tax=Tsukamurella soli TaxID=644556 RepID=A0ABP8K5E2_9ACTN